jgi:hypothetical protein
MFVVMRSDDEEVGDEGPKDHFFEPVEVIHSVMGGTLKGLEESLPGIIARETQQSPEQLWSPSAAPALQLGEVVRDGLTQTE